MNKVNSPHSVTITIYSETKLVENRKCIMPFLMIDHSEISNTNLEDITKALEDMDSALYLE
ncbi:hypothetical protein E2986_13765 [Frieseomelitta varia]|uniref:Uncharacterized protein n=1 Tax=Frieseomelitta varia TaxID=561572 RepID=A0A833RUR2_9HYME|nr:hypothetical protein E2986_13765 [Frieseomelitta varia]